MTISTSGVIQNTASVRYVNSRTYDNVTIVKSLSDFPNPISGVIQLEDNMAYSIDGDVNILNNRINCGVNNAIFGFSQENCYLHNTLINEPLITSDRTIVCYQVTFYVSGSGASILALDASTSPVNNNAIDWFLVNFSGGDIGHIRNYSNCLFNTIGVIDKTDEGLPALGDGISFGGSVDTVAISNSLLFASGSGNTALNFESTAVISRRFRLTDCAVVSVSSAVGVDVDPSATIPEEGAVLFDVNFSGDGTYLSGIDYTSIEARFEGCRGITNTYSAAYITMNGNATETPIASASTPVKVEGTTIGQTVSQKFDVSTVSNRATYTGALSKLGSIKAIVSLSSGNNNEIGVYISKNGVVVDESETYLTTNSGGRLENGICSLISNITTNDYFEVWVENISGTTNVTVEDLSLTIIDV